MRVFDVTGKSSDQRGQVQALTGLIVGHSTGPSSAADKAEEIIY